MNLNKATYFNTAYCVISIPTESAQLVRMYALFTCQGSIFDPAFCVFSVVLAFSFDFLFLLLDLFFLFLDLFSSLILVSWNLILLAAPEEWGSFESSQEA